MSIGYARSLFFYFYDEGGVIKGAIVIDEDTIVDPKPHEKDKKQVQFKSPNSHEPNRVWELTFKTDAASQEFYDILASIASGNLGAEKKTETEAAMKTNNHDDQKAQEAKEVGVKAAQEGREKMKKEHQRQDTLHVIHNNTSRHSAP